MKLTASSRLVFELTDGRVIEVAPPSIAAVRTSLMLDPEDGFHEPPAAQLLRMADQLRALLGNQAEIVESLTVPELRQMLQAITAHLHGFDPQTMVDLMQALDRIAQKKSPPGVMHAQESKPSTT